MRLTLFMICFVAATVSAEPPRLIRTSPSIWAVGVPTNLQSVSLTFDQVMRAGFDSWLGRSSVLPTLEGESLISEDRTTFSMKMKLEPGRVYVFGLNEKGISGVGFQNEHGFSMLPRYLVFQTVGNPAPDAAPPRVLRAVPADRQTVDASRLAGLTITFDRPMNNKKHGLRLLENGTPIDMARLQFNYSPDARSFSMPYQFKPNTQYRLELNSDRNIGFSSSNRIPLWPLQINFTTAAP